MQIQDEFRFTAFAAPREIVELTVFETFTTTPEPPQAAGPVVPVEDEYGDLWLCRETDNSCECIPW